MKFGVPALLVILFVITETTAQNPITGGDSTFRVITTAVPFLTISPDARHAAMGDAGVATSPDANAAFWNPAKLVFIENQYGGSFSYTPWLGKLVNDMWITYLTGFYKITREQAVALSIKYFDLGEIYLRGINNTDEGTFNPREFSMDLTYSRLLTENLSVGLTGRFIHSNLTGYISPSAAGITDARPGKSAAADIGVYYTKPILRGAKNGSLSLAATINNIGAKLSYSDNDNKDFLPTNLRIGAAYTSELDPYNKITFVLDLNKLMVPSPPEYGVDQNGQRVIVRGKDPNRSLLSGMFGSFSDAPNGFSEEVKEFIANMGIEYWYDDTFAARGGYFLESKEKGNRKYMTLGVGFRKEKFGIDVAYLVPTNRREHPLAETIRFTILLQVAKLTEQDPSVTDPQ
jgi:hypothetical protein